MLATLGFTNVEWVYGQRTDPYWTGIRHDVTGVLNRNHARCSCWRTTFNSCRKTTWRSRADGCAVLGRDSECGVLLGS